MARGLPALDGILRQIAGADVPDLADLVQQGLSFYLECFGGVQEESPQCANIEDNTTRYA
ncbi:MAG: hypothetical protein OXG56_11760 [Gammaproteobacteria bacterium]|nr:hypothetical protein [Gammaproteobacteria bacterium]